MIGEDQYINSALKTVKLKVLFRPTRRCIVPEYVSYCMYLLDFSVYKTHLCLRRITNKNCHFCANSLSRVSARVVLSTLDELSNPCLLTNSCRKTAPGCRKKVSKPFRCLWRGSGAPSARVVREGERREGGNVGSLTRLSPDCYPMHGEGDEGVEERERRSLLQNPVSSVQCHAWLWALCLALDAGTLARRGILGDAGRRVLVQNAAVEREIRGAWLPYIFFQMQKGTESFVMQ